MNTTQIKNSVTMLLTMGLGCTVLFVVTLSLYDKEKHMTQKHPLTIKYPSFEPLRHDGFIPDDSTAVKVAEIIWLNIYGKIIYSEKPFFAVLRKDNVWVVKGTLNSSVGGVAYAEIDKKTGAILLIKHGR